MSYAVAERNQSYSLLADEYSLGANSGFDEVQRADRRSFIQDMIGDGYHFVESVRSSNRTFKRHKALAIAQIKRIAGPDNPMKQQQLAAALVEHYKGGGGDNCEVATEEYVAHAASDVESVSDSE